MHNIFQETPLYHIKSLAQNIILSWHKYNLFQHNPLKQMWFKNINIFIYIFKHINYNNYK